MTEKNWKIVKNPDNEIVKVEVKYYPNHTIHYFAVTHANGVRYFTDWGEVKDFVQSAENREQIDHPSGAVTVVYSNQEIKGVS